MNWEAAGAIGEVIGAVAVVATLAFLAVQIRQGHRVQRESNVLARSAAVDRIHDQVQDFSRLLASDPDAVRIWLAGCAGEELETIDRERFDQLARYRISIFTGWEQRAVAVNMRGSAELAVAQLANELRRHPGLRRCWERLRPTLLGRIQDAVAAELARETRTLRLRTRPGTTTKGLPSNKRLQLRATARFNRRLVESPIDTWALRSGRRGAVARS